MLSEIAGALTEMVVAETEYLTEFVIDFAAVSEAEFAVIVTNFVVKWLVLTGKKTELSLVKS